MERPERGKGRGQKIAGAVLLGVGLVLLTISGVYYAYGFIARSGLDDFRYAGERPTEADLGYAVWPSGEDRRIASSGVKSSLNAVESVLASAEQSVAAAGRGTFDAPQDGKETYSLQPVEVLAIDRHNGGAAMPSSETGSLVFTEDAAWLLEAVASAGDVNTTPGLREVSGREYVRIEEGDPGYQEYRPPAKQDIWQNPLIDVDLQYLPPSAFGALNAPVRATRIRIPAVGVDSAVKDLMVTRLNDSYAWQTPNNVVGHIPTTARPAGDGEGWYFGHLESPIRGEGNVFLRLPEISRLLRQNKTVYIYLEDDKRKYKYEVYMTDMIPQEDLRIIDSGQRDITLVTCYPRFYYDQRLLVTAALVGIAERAGFEPDREFKDP